MMKKTIFVFSSLIIALLTLFQVSKFSITSGGFKTEVVLSVVAMLSFAFGVYFIKQYHKKSIIKSRSISVEKIKKLGISSRELEVLQLIAKGMSNNEIANNLYVSESTVKTHVSNLLVKLNAKRRTQAVQIAKELYIIE